MRTILIGLTLAVIVILLAVLALLLLVRAGIRRQERGACLICHPTGPSAAITRRVLNMDFQAPEHAHECRHSHRGSAAMANRRPSLSSKKESAS